MGAPGSFTPQRPRIDYINGKFTHNGCSVKVVMKRGLICIGCSDVTPEAARELVRRYEAHFSDEVVIQP